MMTLKRGGLLFLLAILVLASPVAFSRAWAGASTAVVEQVETRKQACAKASEPLWEGSTAEMMEGNEGYAACLETLVLELGKQYYPATAFGEEGLQVRLGILKDHVTHIYWGILNELNWCKGHCGTMYHVTATAKYGQFLEQLLKEMAEFIDEQNPEP